MPSLFKPPDDTDVDLLIASLQETEGDIRLNPAPKWLKTDRNRLDARRLRAAQELGEIGDARAVEPLKEALKDPDKHIRKAAAEALDTLGWEPDLSSESGAWYWSVREQWKTCTTIGAPAAKPLIVALRDGNGNTRRSVVLALVKIGPPAIEPLIEAFKDGEEDVCQQITKALVKIGSPAIDPLIGALKDEDYDVRVGAAETLNALGWSPGPNEEISAWYWSAREDWKQCIAIGAPAVDPLIVVLKERNIWLCSDAVCALSEIGLPAVVPLIEALQNEDRHVRGYAAEALGRIGDPRAIQPLIGVIKERDWETRKQIAEALDALGWKPDFDDENSAWYWSALENWEICAAIGAPAVEPLVDVLQNQCDEVCNIYAAQALAKIGLPAVEPLIMVLKGQHVLAKESIVIALGEIGDPRAVGPLVDVLLDKSEWVNEDAAKALVKIGLPAVEPLIMALKGTRSRGRGKTIDIQNLVVKALGEIGDPRAVEPLIKALDSDQLMSCIGALGKIGDPRAVEPLIDVLRNKSVIRDKGIGKRTVEYITQTLEMFGLPAVDPLIIALKDDDKCIRRCAIKALGEIGDLRAVAPLTSMLEDEDEDVRQSAAQALTKIK